MQCRTWSKLKSHSKSVIYDANNFKHDGSWDVLEEVFSKNKPVLEQTVSRIAFSVVHNSVTLFVQFDKD